MIYGKARLTKYELGQISQMHDEVNQKCINREELAEQLQIIGLPPKVSRYDLAQRLREIEDNGGRL